MAYSWLNMNSKNRPYKVLLGVTGGIAAYKTPDLVRRLRERGCDVQVVLSKGAEQFITPLTLQAVSGQAVRDDTFDLAAEAAMGHIELARWPDAILIAPTTAECMAKLAHGHANDLLSTLCLATDRPVYLAPAMNRLMWSNAATQANLAILQQRGFGVFGPGEGEQACGETGAGRMLEPIELADLLTDLLVSAMQAKPSTANGPLLTGKRVLLTAGPTIEALDPVRYISNHSSGKMGYAIAQAAQAAGAEVTLISGPTQLTPPPGVKIVSVKTADDMLMAAEQHIQAQDVFIATAAVADYKAKQVADSKIKKPADSADNDELTITLAKNPDILARIASQHPQVFSVGFAAETDNVLDYAQRKLERKNLNMIAANCVADGAVFGQDQNQLTLLWRDKQTLQTLALPTASKTVLAEQLIEHIAKQLDAEQPQLQVVNQ